MAVTTLLGQTFNTTTGTHVVAATPAIGDLITIVCADSGLLPAIPPTDDNPDGLGTYTLISSALNNTSVDLLRAYVRNALIGVSAVTNFTSASGVTTGGGLSVQKTTGLTRSGFSAIRQSAKQENQIGGGTPTPVLGVAALVGNSLVGAVLNLTNPATMTPRGAPVWTELFDAGWVAPTTGVECMEIDNGETGTNIAWGSVSASGFAAIVFELDSSAPPLGGGGNKSKINVAGSMSLGF